MAKFLNLCLLSILLLALSVKSTSTSQNKPQHGPKSLHFVLYQHDILNKTGYVTVNGVVGPPVTETTAPFGTLYALNDPMTFTSNSSSKPAGIVEGGTLSTTFDGFGTVSIYKFNLRLKQHEGSIVIVGGLNVVKPSEIPIVGGTGDFLFVQGYVRTSLEDTKGYYLVFKVEFHIYWPPYAYET